MWGERPQFKGVITNFSHLTNEKSNYNNLKERSIYNQDKCTLLSQKNDQKHILCHRKPFSFLFINIMRNGIERSKALFFKEKKKKKKRKHYIRLGIWDRALYT